MTGFLFKDRGLAWLLVLCCAEPPTGAQRLVPTQSSPSTGSSAVAQNAVRAAVQAEMSADTADKSNWTYRDHDGTPEKDAVFLVVETPQGSLKRMVELDGQPVTGSKRQEESDRIAKFVNSPEEQAKRRKDDAHDDAEAAELLHMLPEAFLWSIAPGSSAQADILTLNYVPNPAFHPPDMQSRVLGVMAGQLVIARDGNRIRTLRGHLTQDVKIGMGILGKLNAGGMFDVERREVAPGHWEITEQHTHIVGHALLFKSIGEQEDEVKTEWKPSSARTLQEAEEQLRGVK